MYNFLLIQNFLIWYLLHFNDILLFKWNMVFHSAPSASVSNHLSRAFHPGYSLLTCCLYHSCLAIWCSFLSLVLSAPSAH